MTLSLLHKKFGRLTVIEGHKTIKHLSHWRAVCACDSKPSKWYCGKLLKRGSIKSCGCIVAENKRNNKYNLKHGMSRTPEYKTWNGILERTNNSKNKDFKNYGGRGVRVHKSYTGKNGFNNWLQEVGRRPSTKHTIDRKNNDLGYIPGNMVWSLPKDQAKNRRSTINLTYKEKTLCQSDWAKELTITPGAIHSWLKRKRPFYVLCEKHINHTKLTLKREEGELYGTPS